MSRSARRRPRSGRDSTTTPHLLERCGVGMPMAWLPEGQRMASREPDDRPADDGPAGRPLNPSAGRSGLDGGGLLGDGRLAVGGLVLVDDALARSLVELAASGTHPHERLLGVTRLGGLAE